MMPFVSITQLEIPNAQDKARKARARNLKLLKNLAGPSVAFIPSLAAIAGWWQSFKLSSTRGESATEESLQPSHEATRRLARF
jgi:hypothetical protein